MDKKTILIFGYGYTSSFLSSLLIKEGWSVFATTREKENFLGLKKTGVHPILFSDKNEIEKTINKGVYILKFYSSFQRRRSSLKRIFFLNVRKKRFYILGRVFFYNQRVYGDKMGEWVTEETVPNPSLPRSIERLKVENSLEKVKKGYMVYH